MTFTKFVDIDNFLEYPKDDINISRKGYLFDASYNDIFFVLGEPTYKAAQKNEYDKVSVEWIIRWEDGLFTTIYDYKLEWKDALCRKKNATDLYDWHIGGSDYCVVSRVYTIFDRMEEMRQGIQQAIQEISEFYKNKDAIEEVKKKLQLA